MAKLSLKKLNKICCNRGVTSATDRLSANIKFSSIDKEMKVISIVSSGKDEGKSTLAFCLAKNLSLEGNAVLLIDLDIYKKSLSHTFNYSHDKHSIADYLTNDVKPENIIKPTKDANLYFLDCVSSVTSVPTLLNNEKFNQLFSILKENFNYVIIDTPPLLACVDSLLVSNLCDGSIMCVRKNKTKKEDLKTAIEQLDASRSHLIGTVLTFSDKKDYGYYSYY